MSNNPVNQTVVSGSSVTFTAAAIGNPSPTVQWQVSTTGKGGAFSNVTDNGTATSGTLTLTNVTLTQNGYAYRAVFTNSGGSSTTTAAILAVPPSVTAYPVSQTVASGATVTFTAAAAGNPSPTVQWQVSTTGTGGAFSNIVGNPTATTGTLSLTNATLQQNGYAYRAVFTNSGGNCTTAAATLIVTVTFNSDADVPLTANNVSISASLTVVLGFAPTPGTDITLINNTGLSFISGRFSNVPQGGIVQLTYIGVTFNFIANYYGGNGRSLVLQWPCVGVDTWGYNLKGQLGNNSTTNSLVPVSVNTSGALAGKTVVAFAGGNSHSLALTADGQVFAWGYNNYGQLGNNSTTNSSVPVPVNTTGALAGKTVVAIAAGNSHNLALTSDGLLFAWGYNSNGQLGNGGTTNSSVPVLVNTGGALAGKMVVAIAGGYAHSLVLTSDGKVFSWGYNSDGELGNNSTTDSWVPVAVNTSGLLAGETVVAIGGGSYHSLALTSDGKVFAWGANGSGQLGNNSTTNSSVPVAVDTSGALAGMTVAAIAAGNSHSLALTSDGQVFTWGYNGYGQLGNNSTTNSFVPVPVNTSGALAGITVVAIAGGGGHCLALDTDGQVFAWGYNNYGQLGNNSTASSSVPITVPTSGALAGQTVLAITGGGNHSLVMFSSGPPSVTTNPVSQTAVSGVSVNFTAAATGNPLPTVKWQVSTTGSSGIFSDITGNPTASTGTLTLTSVTLSQNGYAYQAVFTNNVGSVPTAAAPLTVYTLPVLNLPDNIIVPATSKNGTVVAFNVTASDTVDGTLTPICTPPSGSTFPIGTTTVNCSVTNSLGGSTPGSFTVTVQRTYASFQDQYGLLNPDPKIDPYHTGVCQLLAYAFGVNPSAPDRSQLPLAILPSGYLQISYPRWKDVGDLVYVVEVSSDLQNWNSGIGYTQQVSVSPINGDSTRERVIEQDINPTSNTTRRFIRVRITHL